MPVSAASLADGQLPNSKTTLYTVPASKSAHVALMIFVNTDSSSRTINVYVKRSGSSSRRIIDKDKSISAGAQYVVSLPIGLKLSTGDIIEGDASVANVVDYVLSGGTEAV